MRRNVCAECESEVASYYVIHQVHNWPVRGCGGCERRLASQIAANQGGASGSDSPRTPVVGHRARGEPVGATAA